MRLVSNLYMLDSVNGNVFTMPVPATVNAFVNATVHQIPEINALLAQSVDKAAGDQGFVLFNLDAQTVANLPLSDGFTTVANLDAGTVVCCLATRKVVARALQHGGSSAVICNLATGDVAVVANPDGVTGIGPPAAPGGGARVVLTNAQANTVSAVAYANNRQVGIVVIRVP